SSSNTKGARTCAYVSQILVDPRDYLSVQSNLTSRSFSQLSAASFARYLPGGCRKHDPLLPTVGAFYKNDAAAGFGYKFPLFLHCTISAFLSLMPLRIASLLHVLHFSLSVAFLVVFAVRTS